MFVLVGPVPFWTALFSFTRQESIENLAMI
jgi:hypothetical protein